MATIKTCPQCGNEFEGRSNRMYCSEKCKMAAFYNKNNTEVVNYPTDKPLNNETVNQLTNFNHKSVKQLIPVTVMLTANEKESLELQATECGCELGKYIAVRSQMSESDVNSLEKTIERQKAEIEKLKIEHSFFNRGLQRERPGQLSEGFLIPMNNAQKEYLIHWYLETMDFEMEDIEEEDGKEFDNHKEYYEYKEKVAPGFIYNDLVEFSKDAIFQEIERDLKNYCGSEINFFENPLMWDYNDLKQ